MTTRFHPCVITRAVLMLVILGGAALSGGTTRAADIPFAGDDAFQTGPLTLADGNPATLMIDRAYGPLADDAGRLASSLLGHSVSAGADLDIATADGSAPGLAVTINGTLVPGTWGTVAGLPGVYRMSVPTANILFPQPGDALHPLTPRANTVTFVGGAISLAWMRLTVPGAPPVLYMSGADLSCDGSGPQPVNESFGDWARWLTADGVPYAAPNRDGHLDIAGQLPFLDSGYATLRHTYGPDRAGLDPRVTLVGYSMGGLVAREWAVQHPGVVARFVAISTPNSGTVAADSSLAVVLARCSTGALHDLTPEYVSGFNAQYDLAHYWDPAPANDHVVSLAATPTIGNLSDGLVTKDSALALPYGQKLVWSPTQNGRVLSLHHAVMHVAQVYQDVRAGSRFDQPLRDTRTDAAFAH